MAGIASTLGRGYDDCSEALRVRGWGGIGHVPKLYLPS